MSDVNRIQEQEGVIKLYRELAQVHNIPIAEIRIIVRSQFALIADNIRNTNLEDSTTYDYARLVNFGVFCIDKSAINKYFRYKKINDKLHSESLG